MRRIFTANNLFKFISAFFLIIWFVLFAFFTVGALVETDPFVRGFAKLIIAISSIGMVVSLLPYGCFFLLRERAVPVWRKIALICSAATCVAYPIATVGAINATDGVFSVLVAVWLCFFVATVVSLIVSLVKFRRISMSDLETAKSTPTE